MMSGIYFYRRYSRVFLEYRNVTRRGRHMARLLLTLTSVLMAGIAQASLLERSTEVEVFIAVDRSDSMYDRRGTEGILPGALTFDGVPKALTEISQRVHCPKPWRLTVDYWGTDPKTIWHGVIGGEAAYTAAANALTATSLHTSYGLTDHVDMQRALISQLGTSPAPVKIGFVLTNEDSSQSTSDAFMQAATKQGIRLYGIALEKTGAFPAAEYINTLHGGIIATSYGDIAHFIAKIVAEELGSDCTIS